MIKVTLGNAAIKRCSCFNDGLNDEGWCAILFYT